MGMSSAQNIRRIQSRHLQFISGLAVCITLIFFSGVLCAPTHVAAKEYFHFTDLAMGTVIQLTVDAPNRESAKRAAKKAFIAIHTLEKDFNHRCLSGSVGQLNSAAGKKPVKVTPEAFSLIQRTLLFCEKTHGLFDITIGVISTKPYYYKDLSEDNNDLINFRLVRVNSSERTVFLPREGMALDLGGVAKGTIVDYAVLVLKNEGICTGIVEAGGDLFCFGEKKWDVGIEHPRLEGLLGVISTNNKAVCTSGDYRQFSYMQGRHTRSHHIIDPDKMKSADRSIGVTVIAPTAELADALATTLFIMGPEAGKEFLAKNYPNSSALWVLPDLKLMKTKDFPLCVTK